MLTLLRDRLINMMSTMCMPVPSKVLWPPVMKLVASWVPFSPISLANVWAVDGSCLWAPLLWSLELSSLCAPLVLEIPEAMSAVSSSSSSVVWSLVWEMVRTLQPFLPGLPKVPKRTTVVSWFVWKLLQLLLVLSLPTGSISVFLLWTWVVSCQWRMFSKVLPLTSRYEFRVPSLGDSPLPCKSFSLLSLSAVLWFFPSHPVGWLPMATIMRV